MKRWKRQNRIQKYGRSIYEFFKPAKMAYQFETYKPKINRKRLVLGTAFIGFCIATPATNVMIPSTVRWIVR